MAVWTARLNHTAAAPASDSGEQPPQLAAPVNLEGEDVAATAVKRRVHRPADWRLLRDAARILTLAIAVSNELRKPEIGARPVCAGIGAARRQVRHQPSHLGSRTREDAPPRLH